MNRFSNEEMAEMHLAYGEARGNAREAARIYNDRFPGRIVADPRTFTAMHRRLRETGTFAVNRLDAGRPRRRDDNQDLILRYFHEHPNASCRSAAAALGIPNHMRVWNVLHENQHHPFRYQRVQALMPADFLPRINFSNWLLNNTEQRRDFSSLILFTDEAQFSREGIFNNQNMHFWAVDNPHVTRERGFQHRFHVNVWAGIIGNRLIGPHIFPGQLDGEMYAIFLQYTLPRLLRNIPNHVRRIMWFQHDGAPPHFSRAAREVLENAFPNRWIGRGGPVPWPPRSPDLTPLDFFLWGHMKSLIYETPVESENDLLARIVVASGEIEDNPAVLERVHDSLQRRCRLCVAQNGRHFEQLL